MRKPCECERPGSVELPLFDREDGRCYECGGRLVVSACGCVRPATGPQVRALSEAETNALMEEAELAAYGAQGRRPRRLAGVAR